MSVTVLARTIIDPHAVADYVGDNRTANEIGLATPADDLAEVAGRACYKAYNKNNPATEYNSGYLRNILEQQHYSVLEHSSVTFGVTGVSRALLLELERHRFLSFSVESQRYVDTRQAHPEPVYPPAMANSVYLRQSLRTEYEQALEDYNYYVEHLGYNGYSRKEAREAARAVLPNCTPTDFVVSGNIRAWRDTIAKRYHPAADAEIRLFAGEVLKHLRCIAPHSVQDIEDLTNE